MLNIIHCVRTLGIVCILGVMLQNSCYADFITTIDEISVKCSPTPEEAQSQIYLGEPNTYLELATKGIKVEDEDEIVTNWDGGNNGTYVIAVIGACFVSDGESMWWTKVINMLTQPLPTLQCERGEGIEIKMRKQNYIDPNKYQYLGNLKTKREIKKHVRKSHSIIPSPPPIDANILDINASAFPCVRS